MGDEREQQLSNVEKGRSAVIFGYVRVSTKKQEKGQSIEEQTAAILARYPDAEIIIETHGGNKHRPEFDGIIKRALPGDIICAVDHTRYSRDTSEGLRIAKELMNRGVLIHFLSFGMLENTPTGHYVLTLLLANAELELSQIVSRTQPARRRARKKPGYRDGRPPKYSKKQLSHALELLEDKTYKEVEEITGISKSTLIRAIRNREGESTEIDLFNKTLHTDK